MPSLLKRKSNGQSNGSAAMPAGGPDGEAAAAPPEAQAGPPPEPPPSVRGSSEPPATYEMPGTIEFDPPISYEPAPPPPDPPRSSGSLLARALGDPGESTAEERDRIAAAEFEAAIAPVLDLMREAVPGAGTPEEAERILWENQGEVTPDPKGGAYVHGDAFDEDARVYYRLLRRNYEKNPRPSEKKSVSHHLHGVYGKLTGTKGW